MGYKIVDVLSSVRTWLNRIAKAEDMKPEPGVFWVWWDASQLEVLKLEVCPPSK